MKATTAIEIFDEKMNKYIGTAEIQFGLETLIVRECDFMSCLELESLLENRAELPRTYEVDDIVLSALGLLSRKREFGRMSEAKILYAMLNHFALLDENGRPDYNKDDGIRVYPLKDEIVCMFMLDRRYPGIYLWEARKNDLAEEEKL